MKKLTKLIALLTAAMLTVPSFTVSAEDLPDTEQTEQTVGGMKKIVEIYSMIRDFLNSSNIDARTEIDNDMVIIRLYDYHTAEEETSLIEAFIEENDIDPSAVNIYADMPDTAIQNAADMINVFIAEEGLNANAYISENAVQYVFVEISDWHELRPVSDKVKEFMAENDIDESEVCFFVSSYWDEENGVMRGDMNDSGSLTSYDLSILKECVGSSYGDTLPLTADMNDDGKADSEDVLILEKQLNAREIIEPDSTIDLEYTYTHSCLSEISVSGSNAVCKSLTYAYYKASKITVVQTLQKKDTSGRWENVKTWKKTFKDYKAAVKNTSEKLSKGFYRLKTTSVVYSGSDNETVTKYSRKYAVGVSPDMGDANGDGKVNVRDCAYIAKMLAKGKSLPDKADYNLDGKKNVRDAAALAAALADVK